MKHDIFLSHNGADKLWTENLASDIEDNTNGDRLKVFFDKWDISPGSDVPRELENGLKESKFVGLVMTPEAFNSDWVSLEISTAIYSDPAARKKRIIPILRRDCEIPLTLKRISRIDFRDDNLYEKKLSILLATLRGEPLPRGKKLPIEAINEEEDKKLFELHLVAFDRPAFRITCVYELFIKELSDAVDNTQTALNTGKLYSRDGHLLENYSGARHFKTDKYKSSFRKIQNELTKLKYFINEFEHSFKNQFPSYSHHGNFYSMFHEVVRSNSGNAIKNIILEMDKVDSKRNDVLKELNSLNPKSPFELIELSSSVLNKGMMGGDLVTKYLPKGF